MPSLRVPKLLIASFSLALSLTGPAWSQPLQVAADAALAEAVGDVARAFEASRPGVAVQLKLAASGTLLDQLAQGEMLDVLVSADAETVVRGIERRLLASGSQHELATHALVLVAPARRGPALQRLTDLARPEVLRIAIGRLASVPGGRLAREAIDAERLWPAVQRKVVWLDDTRQVLAAVARGDVDAGFVFRSDAATASDTVRVVQVLQSAVPVRVTAAVATRAGGPQAVLAREFIAALAGSAARESLTRHAVTAP